MVDNLFRKIYTKFHFLKKYFITNPVSNISDQELKKIWIQKNQNKYQDKIENHKILNENSRELVDFISSQRLFNEEGLKKIHEIGCGSGRNLKYLKSTFPYLRISGNDLDRQSCFDSMDDSIKSIIEFSEIDTYEFLKNKVKEMNQVDVLLASDHLMHLSRTIILEVYILMAKFARNVIILREPYGKRVIKKMDVDKHEFVWASDIFAKKFPGFTLVKSQRCKNAGPGKDFTLMYFKRVI